MSDPASAIPGDDCVRVTYSQLARKIRDRGLLFVWSEDFNCWLDV